jgi:four helix bundle protein
MARDHRRLRVYHEAHSIAIAIYRETRDFPRDEWFGIRSQIRRAAVSTVSNLVEGNARCSIGEYVSFLNISRASAAEVAYLVQLSFELSYLSASAHRQLTTACNQLIPQLERLVQRMQSLQRSDPRDQRPKTRD